jgi:hypothetical protein
MFCDKRSPLVSPGRAKSAQADCGRAAARGAAVLDGAQQLVLADDPLRLLHEINQQVEDLRLDHDRLAAAPQLAARDIEDISSNLNRMRFQPRAEGFGAALRVS